MRMGWREMRKRTTRGKRRKGDDVEKKRKRK